MFLIGFPLLIVPFAIYNMIAFLLPGIGWTQEMARIHMMSGADWVLTPGELLIAFSVLVLFLELMKATRLSTRTIIDHALSTLESRSHLDQVSADQWRRDGEFVLMARLIDAHLCQLLCLCSAIPDEIEASAPWP